MYVNGKPWAVLSNVHNASSLIQLRTTSTKDPVLWSFSHMNQSKPGVAVLVKRPERFETLKSVHF